MILGRNETPFPDNPHCKRCASKNCRELLVQPLVPGKVIFVHRRQFCSIPDYIPSWRNEQNPAPAEESALTDELEVVSGPVIVTNPRWEHKKSGEDTVADEKSEDTASFGDKIILMADVSGMPEGAGITFDIYENSQDPAMRVDSAKGKIENGVGKGEWVVADKSGLGADSKLAFEGIAKSKASERCEIQLVATMIIDVYFEDKDGNKISKLTPARDVNLIVKTSNLQGKMIDIDLSDSFIDFEYNGKILENDILNNLVIDKDEMIVNLRTIKGK